MLASSIPVKFPIPFANGVSAPYIRSIPQASQIGVQPGAASLTDGFPPLTFLPVGSGGIPPFGQDFNGILLQISQWAQWLAAGGPIIWDSAFSTAIGGYPNGAIVQSATTPGNFWLCTADNNTTNPDTGGANWLGYSPTGGTARIQTLSGAFTTLTTDQYVGLNRTASPSASSTTLPAGVSPGKIIVYQDLADNMFSFPLTVFPNAGATIAGLTFSTTQTNRGTVTYTFYGSNLWGVNPP